MTVKLINICNHKKICTTMLRAGLLYLIVWNLLLRKLSNKKVYQAIFLIFLVLKQDKPIFFPFNKIFLTQ